MPRRTLRRAVERSGAGLHTGSVVRLRLGTGPAGSGIVFVRTDLAPPALHRATLAGVGTTDRRTVLGHGAGRVETVEHLLAALSAHRVDDAVVELDGPEVPILDGSFSPWSEAVDSAGVIEVAGPERHWLVTEPFEVREGDAGYHVFPASGVELKVVLEHTEPVIGRQQAEYLGAPGEFDREIASARTYGFLYEVEGLQARGLLAGASQGAGILLGETAPLNTTLRWADEFARHKLGDLLGDLALLGAPLRGRVEADRPGHRGNIACARAIAARARLVEEE